MNAPAVATRWVRKSNGTTVVVDAVRAGCVYYRAVSEATRVFVDDPTGGADAALRRIDAQEIGDELAGWTLQTFLALYAPEPTEQG